ncbi:MAG: hypothetical protein NTU63_01100 [Candidatus Pacearchaeota archaeon]|nr:hypothetical protein [Candidatus Pacearchaeota archaeon]
MKNNLLTMCRGCERIRVDGEWFDRDSYSTYDEMVRTHNITDDYCPECTETFKKKSQELKNQYSLLRN